MQRSDRQTITINPCVFPHVCGGDEGYRKGSLRFLWPLDTDQRDTAPHSLLTYSPILSPIFLDNKAQHHYYYMGGFLQTFARAHERCKQHKQKYFYFKRTLRS